MPGEGSKPPHMEHEALLEAVKVMRRSQFWVLIAADREIVEQSMGGLPRVYMIAMTKVGDLDFNLTNFYLAHRVVEGHLRILMKQKEEQKDG